MRYAILWSLLVSIFVMAVIIAARFIYEYDRENVKPKPESKLKYDRENVELKPGQKPEKQNKPNPNQGDCYPIRFWGNTVIAAWCDWEGYSWYCSTEGRPVDTPADCQRGDKLPAESISK